MSVLFDIEQVIGQVFFFLFKQLQVVGWLSWGSLYLEWFEVVFLMLQVDLLVLLYVQEYELLEYDELFEVWQELIVEDYYNFLCFDLQFLLFVWIGGGDSYCFWSNVFGFVELFVVLVWYDDDCVDVLVVNYQDFLFCKMVEVVVDY